MTNTKYIISSRKVIAVALAIVMFAMMFVGCTKNEPVNNDGTTTTESTTLSQSEESTTLADNQTGNEESTTLADENNENENNTSKYNSDETTTKKNTSTGGKETTTKKNTSTGSSNNVTTTTKLNTATCTHSWGEWKWSSAKECMISTCSKCGATMTPDDCNHTYDNWEYRYDSKYRKCTKCPHSETIEGDFTAQCMGSKSEYLELLGYVNQARREAGLNELVYITEWQQGADTRAQELTVKFSHTRPDGTSSNTAYSYSSLYRTTYGTSGENIVSGARTAKSAFGCWMNSSGHRYTILYDDPNLIGFVASRCDTYWVMQTIYDYTPYL